MRKPIFIGHEIYRSSTYGAGHPLAIPRVSLATDLVRAMGWLTAGNFRESPQASIEALSDFHDPGYLRALLAAEQRPPTTQERARYHIGANGNPVFPEMFRRPATACGGGLLAVELLRSGQATAVFNIAGGQHHGQPDRASGFCYLNEPVLTLRQLLKSGARRVFYLDIDAHFGDAVQLAFHDNDQVFTLSIHEQARWPQNRDQAPGDPGSREDRAGGMARNLPVPGGLNDTEFGHLIDHVVMPLIAGFAPDVVYLQCGCDGLADDPQSKLALSNRAIWRTVALLQKAVPRLIVSGGGGYNPYAVGRCWAGVWATLNGFAIPERLPAPAQALLGDVKWNHRKGRAPSAAWLTTLADRPNDGPIGDAIYRLADISP
ncbi:MAG: acetoin utilization protein AcuC [Rhodospirillales bacterium]|nr:acetoin utilization protein AcuC [Rhodospirillales bacterium]